MLVIQHKVENHTNKASQSDLRKLSSFLQKHAKKQPPHSGSCWRRYAIRDFSQTNFKRYKIDNG
jgi:hypothetical protein